MKVVLITGCSSGFGELMALEFAREGARVFASVRCKKDAAKLSGLATAEGLRLQVVEFDVCDLNAIEVAIKSVLDEVGFIDVLVNNAGIFASGVVEDVSKQRFKAVMDTNFFGAVYMVQAVLPAMRKRRSGTVIMMSSLSALVGLPCDSAYAASKAALERFSESLYLEMQGFGIQIKIVQPGSFDTMLASKALADSNEGLSDYKGLSDSILSGNSEDQREGDDPMLLAKEVIRIAQPNVKQLYFPIGSQAHNVVARLNAAAGVPREELLSEFAGLECG